MGHGDWRRKINSYRILIYEKHLVWKDKCYYINDDSETINDLLCITTVESVGKSKYTVNDTGDDLLFGSNIKKETRKKKKEKKRKNKQLRKNEKVFLFISDIFVILPAVSDKNKISCLKNY